MIANNGYNSCEGKNGHIPSMGERPLWAVASVNRETGGLLNYTVNLIKEICFISVSGILDYILCIVKNTVLVKNTVFKNTKL